MRWTILPALVVALTLAAVNAAAQTSGVTSRSAVARPYHGHASNAAPGAAGGNRNSAGTRQAPVASTTPDPSGGYSYMRHGQDTSRGPGLVPSFPKVPPGANPPGAGASVPETGAPGER